MATIRIPTPLRKLTQGKEEVNASGATIGALIANLETQYPGIKERICDDAGQVRRFVNIFANDEDIRFLKNLDTPVKDSDEISIVPAIAGGVTLGAALRLIESGHIGKDDGPVVICVTGNGMKTQDPLVGNLPEPQLIGPKLSDFDDMWNRG